MRGFRPLTNPADLAGFFVLGVGGAINEAAQAQTGFGARARAIFLMF